MVFASSWKELRELGARHPGSPALVDPGFEDAEYPLSAMSIRASPRQLSGTPLIRYAGTISSEHRLTDASLPFAARLHADLDDELSAIDAAILRCADVESVDRLLARLQRCADPYTHEVFRRTLDLAIGAPVVRTVAANLGLTERTLQRRCAALGIPSPKTIISLARIFAVERLAAWSRQPSGAVALALGFSHRSNYRRLVRQHFGAPPSAVREDGGADRVAEAVVAALADRRAGPPDLPKPIAETRLAPANLGEVGAHLVP